MSWGSCVRSGTPIILYGFFRTRTFKTRLINTNLLMLRTPCKILTMTEDTQSKLSGSDAVDLAAEKWKESAQRNIPTLGDLPIAEDTANLRQGPSLNDGLLALLPLVGVWRGTGKRIVDDKEETIGQQIIIAHDGENHLSYDCRTWKNETLINRELGFWRISPKDEIELIVTNSGGVAEIFYGQPLNERAWELESASTMATATGPANLGAGKRLYGLMPNNNLGWVEERMVDGELSPKQSAELSRIIG